jgi:hypothetical protein
MSAKEIQEKLQVIKLINNSNFNFNLAYNLRGNKKAPF